MAIIEDEREEPLADVNAKLAGYPWMSLLASKLRLLLLGFKRDKGGRELAETHGLFVDGGVTPFNNPTMALLMMTQRRASTSFGRSDRQAVDYFDRYRLQPHEAVVQGTGLVRGLRPR